MLEHESNLQLANLRLAIAAPMVNALNLDAIAAEIDPDAPLYGVGLGLDSIAILGVAAANG